MVVGGLERRGTRNTYGRAMAIYRGNVYGVTGLAREMGWTIIAFIGVIAYIDVDLFASRNIMLKIKWVLACELPT